MSLTTVQRAVAAANKAVTSKKTAQSVGSGVAYQSVAQSAALAVQSGSTYLSSVTVVSSAAIAVAIAQIVAKAVEGQPPKPWPQVITAAQTAIDGAAKNFATIGTNAHKVLSDFSS